jgi:hypothetical protein
LFVHSSATGFCGLIPVDRHVRSPPRIGHGRQALGLTRMQRRIDWLLTARCLLEQPGGSPAVNDGGGAKRTFSRYLFSSSLPSTTARPHESPPHALTSGAAPSSSPALPATPLARYPVVGVACDQIHALAASPPKSNTDSARLPNRRPCVGEGTAAAAYGDGFRRRADHASDHSSHLGTS